MRIKTKYRKKTIQLQRFIKLNSHMFDCLLAQSLVGWFRLHFVLCFIDKCSVSIKCFDSNDPFKIIELQSSIEPKSRRVIKRHAQKQQQAKQTIGKFWFANISQFHKNTFRCFFVVRVCVCSSFFVVLFCQVIWFRKNHAKHIFVMHYLWSPSHSNDCAHREFCNAQTEPHSVKICIASKKMIRYNECVVLITTMKW